MQDHDSQSGALKARTKSFAVSVIKIVQPLPNKPEGWIIGKQVLRSATSVAANYRAACRARSKQEFIAKIGVVSAEADETILWLELLIEAGLVPEKQLAAVLQEAHELSAIFTTSYNTACGSKHFGNSAVRQFRSRDQQ
jgi:four helix bundle protein